MEHQETKMDKNLSPIGVWALAVGCIIGWGAFIMPGDTFLHKAGPLGTALAMLIASVVMIVISYNYNYMVNKYPVTGGAFAYTKLSFGENHAFLCSWFLGLAYLAIVPLNGTALALISRVLLNNVFQVGFHYTVAGYEIYLGEVLLGCAVLALFAFLCSRGVQFTGIFQTILVFSLIIGVLIFIGAALISDKASFANLHPVFSPEVAPLGGILSVVAVAPWAFVGYETIPQAVEEFKFSPKKTHGIMAASILIGAAVYVILNTATAMTLPEQFATWADYIAALPTLTGLISLPTFHAADMLLGSAGLIFLGLAVLAAILSSIIGFYMATSRLLYSMSREKVLPGWFGQIHPRYKTPANAVLFTLAASLVALPFGRTALEWIVNMSSVGAAIGSCYTCAAALKLARSEHKLHMIVMSVLGLMFSGLFLVLLLVPIPGFQCSLNGPAYICLVVWGILGAVFYLQSRKKRNQ